MSYSNFTKSAVFRGALVAFSLFAANCSGKTYSTFFQPFDLVFGGKGSANASDPVTLLAATPITPTRVMLTFDEPVTLATAQIAANYSIVAANGIPVVVLAAVRDPNNTSVVFVDTTPQTAGSVYTVTVSNITGIDGSVLSSGQRTATFTGPIMQTNRAPRSRAYPRRIARPSTSILMKL